MSTNFYVKTTDAKMVFDFGKRVEIDYKNRFFEIHLGQIAGDNKILLETHSYDNFKDMVDFLTNKGYVFTIEDEYGQEMSVKSFIKMVLDYTQKGKTRIVDNWHRENVIVDENGCEWMDCEFS